MDFDILIWILIAALPVISGLLEKKRAGERRRNAEGPNAEGPAEFQHSEEEPELSASEVIERILSGEPAPKPKKERAKEFRSPIPEPHWDTNVSKQPVKGTGKSQLTKMLEAPIEVVPMPDEPEIFTMPTGNALRQAVIVSEIFGPPKSRRSHR